MSVDLNFDRAISFNDIVKKTSLKIVINNDSKFLEDEYGNVVFAKGDEYLYGITLYGPRNVTKILDELIINFNIKFIDDNGQDELRLLSEKIFNKNMEKYGYFKDGSIFIPKRCEEDYKKIENENGDDGLPF